MRIFLAAPKNWLIATDVSMDTRKIYGYREFQSGVAGFGNTIQEFAARRRGHGSDLLPSRFHDALLVFLGAGADALFFRPRIAYYLPVQYGGVIVYRVDDALSVTVDGYSPRLGALYARAQRPFHVAEQELVELEGAHLVAEAHDRALAELSFDVRECGVKRLVAVSTSHGSLPSVCPRVRGSLGLLHRGDDPRQSRRQFSSGCRDLGTNPRSCTRSGARTSA